jgi:hypothetical protein
MFPFYMLLLFGMLVLGLILVVAGVVMLLKVSNKLPGWIAIAAGVLFTLSPIAVFLALITIRTVG